MDIYNYSQYFGRVQQEKRQQGGDAFQHSMEIKSNMLQQESQERSLQREDRHKEKGLVSGDCRDHTESSNKMMQGKGEAKGCQRTESTLPTMRLHATRKRGQQSLSTLKTCDSGTVNKRASKSEQKL